MRAQAVGPFVLELFAGCGGMAEGLRRAGLRPAAAVERDVEACDSYERNLGSAPIRLDVPELLRLVGVGWRPGGPLDLVVADPPCDASSAGGDAPDGDGVELLRAVVELMRLLRPRAYLIATLPGVDEAPGWASAQHAIGELGRLGYCVRDCAHLDAADYGVPQHRVRAFWYGHLDGPCLRWPERTHGAPPECATLALPGTRALRPWVTCRDVLARLSPDDLGQPIRLRWWDAAGRACDEASTTTSEPVSLAVGTEALAGADRRPSEMDSPARPLPRDAFGDGALLVGSSARIRPPTRAQSSVGAIRLSEKAAAVLQGFPEGWQIAGKTKRSRWEQIATAVPPPLAEAVGRSVLAALRARRPARVVVRLPSARGEVRS